MAAVTCPRCAAPSELAPGASATCGCGADFWAVPGRDAGEPFTGVIHDRAGALAVVWSMVAAGGVLAALLGILAAEVWGVVALVQYWRA